MPDIIPKEGYQFINSFFYSQDSTDRGTNLDLMLIKNISVDEDIKYADLIEVDDTGYSRIELLDIEWVISDSKVSLPKQSFTVTEAGGSFSSITGYAIVTKGTSPKIIVIGLNKYGSITINEGETFSITPQIYNTTKNKIEDIDTWTPPSYWLTIPEPLGDNEVYLLKYIEKRISNETTLLFDGTCPTVLIDWGDGSTPESISTGNVATHVYDFDNPNLNTTLTPEGYKQVIISISKDSEGDITDINLEAGTIPNNIFDIIVQCSTMTTLEGLDSITLKRLRIVGSNSLSNPNINSSSIESVMIESLSSATSLENLLRYCTSLVDVSLPTDYSGISSMREMFYGCESLTKLPNLNTTGVTDFYRMFSSCSLLEEAPFLDMSSATSISQMFSNCYNLKKVPLYDFSSVNDASRLFTSCYQLKYIPLFDFSSITGIEYAFYSCVSLERIPFSSLPLVTDISSLFTYCYSLKEIDTLDCPEVTVASSLFSGCYSLRKIGSLNLPKAINGDRIFNNNESLQHIDYLNLPLVTSYTNLFTKCNSLISINSIDVSSLEDLDISSSKFLQRLNITSISKSFTIDDTNLSVSSIVEIFNGLDDLTATTSETFTINNTWGTNNLSSTDIEIATNKNWEVIIDGVSYPPT